MSCINDLITRIHKIHELNEIIKVAEKARVESLKKEANNLFQVMLYVTI